MGQVCENAVKLGLIKRDKTGRINAENFMKLFSFWLQLDFENLAIAQTALEQFRITHPAWCTLEAIGLMQRVEWAPLRITVHNYFDDRPFAAARQREILDRTLATTCCNFTHLFTELLKSSALSPIDCITVLRINTDIVARKKEKCPARLSGSINWRYGH